MTWPLAHWLKHQALPFWAAHGLDRRNGGFIERFTLTGEPLHEPQRTRVAARQIYVFATAGSIGLMDDGAQARAVVDHGLAFLLQRLRKADGSFATALAPGATAEDSPFQLYEHAFVLFALAKAHALDRQHYRDLAPLALQTLQMLRSRYGHPAAGFEESRPPSEPLRANPHMHLFEAALAWLKAAPEAPGPWSALADELAALALQRFIDPASGALRELFDAQWQALPADQGQVIEPGHQFEWAWLLADWAALRHHEAARAAAQRLIAVGESRGVDAARNVAIDALSPSLDPQDRHARLWPQTERLKAWCTATTLAPSPAEARSAAAQLALAHDGLMAYASGVPAGLWREGRLADGGWSAEPTRASSLYHLVCACETLLSTPGLEPPDPVGG